MWCLGLVSMSKLEETPTLSFKGLQYQIHICLIKQEVAGRLSTCQVTTLGVSFPFTPSTMQKSWHGSLCSSSFVATPPSLRLESIAKAWYGPRPAWRSFPLTTRLHLIRNKGQAPRNGIMFPVEYASEDLVVREKKHMWGNDNWLYF